TLLNYDADAVVGGVIGGVGQRMLAGVAKKLAGEFFTGVDAVLTGATPAVQPSAGEPPTATGRPAVYQAPEVPAKAGAGEPVSFILGAVFGAAAALAGVLVGVRVSRRD